MREFGNYHEKCPKCGEYAFEYGLSRLEGGERLVATGKCKTFDFVPETIEWSRETGFDAEHEGFDLLSAAYDTCEWWVIRP